MAILPRILAFVLRKTKRFLMSIFLLQLLAALTTRPFLRPVVQRTLLAIFLPFRAHTILASTSIFIDYFGRCVTTYPSIASKPTIIVAVDVTIILNFSSFALLNIFLISLRFF